MNNARLRFLFERYFSKTASKEERAELADLIGMESHREDVMELFAAAWEKYEGEGVILSDERSDEMVQSILSMPAPSMPVNEAPGEGAAAGEAPAGKVRRMAGWVKVAAAAVVILLGSTWLYEQGIFKKSIPDTTRIAKGPSPDVAPGRYKASLVLDDGRRITLDSAGPGQLALQGNTKVISKNGGLQYQQGAGKSGPVMYNTLATGPGETYSFLLADGSKVWLNAGSSIHFPVAFPGRERRIGITGEVYIQVARHPEKTFVVTAGGMEVQALGTEFNVNAYPDEENINTTLIQGAVKVARGGENEELKPGQQTKLYRNGHLSQPAEVDVEEVVSWKNGNFQFESADIKSILRQFARWYDVEVIYQGAIKDRKFFCIVSRNSTLANVLQMLKDSDIKFRIEGKKLYVTSG